MKKSTSLLFSGLLVSGMVLGAASTPTTVHADDNTATTQATTNVTNNVTYYDQSGKEVGQKSNLEGTKGSAITYVPDGYALAKDSNPTFGNDQDSVSVKVTSMISVKVNYVDQNGNLVNSEVVNGGDGTDYTLTDIPAGCSWINDKEQKITLVNGKEYNVPVNKKVFNTVIFKTADDTEVGKTEVYGDKVGDAINLTSDQLPSGYKAQTTSLTLQTDNNTQFVTVTKAEDAATGTVTVNGKDTPLYTVYGNVITGRNLKANTSWKVFETKVIKGQTYYRVATNEWVPASAVTIANADTENVTPFTGVVTTKDKATTLYTKDGQAITGRGLRANSGWQTANKMVLNGTTYYQVATNEWVKADDVTLPSTSSNVTPAVGVVTTKNQVATLYTKDGQAITGRGLAANSDWQTANKMTLKGETYYQVATNEWVKASSLKL